MAKYTQAQVSYRRGLAETQCAKCSMYRKNGSGTFGTCTAVTGQITPYGVCDVFAGLINPFGRLPHAERVAHVQRRLRTLIANPY